MRYGKLALAAIGAALSAVGGASTAAAPAADDLAARFGAREEVQQISLSPDGRHIAAIVPVHGRGQAVMVADLVAGGDMVPVLRASGDPEQVSDCRWSTDTRLICTIYATQMTADGRLGFSRLVTLGSDGSGLRMLSTRTNDRSTGYMQEGGSLVDWGGDGSGAALVTRMFVPENQTGTHIASSRAGLGVDAVDTATLARRTVEQPRGEAVEYISDGHGTVRIMGVRPRNGSGYDGDHVSYFFRKPGSRDWQPLSKVTSAGGIGSGFDPYAVDRDRNVAYGFDAAGGHNALYSMALDGTGKRELLLSRPDVDVDSLVRIGRQARVVGASYVTDRRETQFFDPDLKKLQASLARALPPGTLVSFVDASADEKKLLLFAGSDVDPGRYYLFDRDTRKLAEVLQVRPALAATRLATVKAITYRAADGTAIPAYLTLPAGSDGRNLPAIVMPHGGPGSRDEWGFDWLSQFFAARGYAVIQPEFRGSTGYGDAWFQKNGFRSWRTAVGDVNDAGRYLQTSGIAAPGKLAVVGWSYGGYAALQSAVLDPDLFKAIVAVAPVTDLAALKEESRGFTNYELVSAFVGSGPQLREASPAQNVAAIKAPVLLFHGDRDQNVGVGESRLMASRLKGAGKKVDYVEFKGLAHQLSDDGARAELLGKADAFLREALKL